MHWEEIPYSLGYFISEDGRVRYPTGYVTKGRLDNKGYLRAEIVYEFIGKRTVKVHRLVAEAFCEMNGGEEVNHKDSDKTNNYWGNLEWCSRQENMDHYYKEGNVVVLKGEDHGCAKLTEEDVLTIREMILLGTTSREISTQYPVTEQMIYRIKYRKAWKHI